jgi:hypothetical protein
MYLESGIATVEVVASDPDGTIGSVEVFEDGHSIGQATGDGKGRYTLRTPPLSNGKRRIAAFATDNGGKVASTRVIVLVVNGHAVVAIEQPAQNTVIVPESKINLIAHANHPTEKISSVEFFNGEELLGKADESGNGKYTLTVSRVDPGVNSITAVATDTSGARTYSTVLSVVSANAPNVSIIKPANNSSLQGQPVIPVAVNSKEQFGAISKVDLYANGQLIGTSTDGSGNEFDFNWKRAQKGVYKLTAVATDSYGQVVTSSPVTVTIN